MRKIDKVEVQKKQLLYQFLERLNSQIPQQKNVEQLEESWIQQYKLLVNMSFSANILFRGVDYANHLYNHIVKIEYTRLCKLVIKQDFEQQIIESILRKLKQAYNELLKFSPVTKQSEGIDIFYGFTGGNRKKYKANRHAIKQMYLEIKQESKKSFYRHLKETYYRKRKRLKEKKTYTLWLLKSHIWH